MLELSSEELRQILSGDFGLGGKLYSGEDLVQFRPIITERQQRAVDLYRMFHSDGLQTHEVMQSDKFDTYLSMFDVLVRIQRGDV